MPIVTLTFNHEINTSVQVGDKAYYVFTSPVGPVGSGGNNPDSADRESIREMFSKDNKVNLGSLAGYYSDVKLRNSSKEYAELFTVNSDYAESSK